MLAELSRRFPEVSLSFIYGATQQLTNPHESPIPAMTTSPTSSQPSSQPALTLITAPESPHLSAARLNELQDATGLTTPLTWLADEEAVDLNLDRPLDEKETSALREKVEGWIADRPIDYALSQTGPRRKRLLISDMDSTIIEQECIDEIAFMAGIKPRIAAITERAMRGEIEFDDALRERVGLLKGLETEALETVINERLSLSPGARTLVRTMAEHGAYCALVSGGFTFFTDRIAKLTGFHITQANILEMSEEKLTGNVIPPILGSAAKKEALLAYLAEKGLAADESLAVGDGANDLEMIRIAGLGVAYRAKPIVAAEAKAAVNHTNLTALLYMQGYKKSEFILD